MNVREITLWLAGWVKKSNTVITRLYLSWGLYLQSPDHHLSSPTAQKPPSWKDHVKKAPRKRERCPRCWCLPNSGPRHVIKGAFEGIPASTTFWLQPLEETLSRDHSEKPSQIPRPWEGTVISEHYCFKPVAVEWFIMQQDTKRADTMKLFFKLKSVF